MNFSLAVFLIVLLWTCTGWAEQITLGYSGTGLNSTLRRVIEKEKLWQKRGLDVRAVYFSSGNLTSQALLGGDIQIADGDLNAPLTMVVAGALDLKIFAVTFPRLQHLFVVRNPIEKPQDLKGKRVAVSSYGSVSDSMTRLVLRFWKLEPEKELTILPSGNTPTRIAALVSGRVDAALVTPEQLHRVLATGCCRVLADLSDVPLEYALYGLVAPTSLLKSQPAVVRRFLEGVVEGIAVFKTRQDVVLEVLKEEGIKDRDLAVQIHGRLVKALRPEPEPDPAGVQAVLDSSLNPRARTARAQDFIDTSLLDQIRASGAIDRFYRK
ncbi:MAG TPA: ABC transporter substrate-binding protein [Candidatus Binatia bacterium]|nr:ABC transporter substrate-binding protein [Candidatus Binatia bacterium]